MLAACGVDNHPGRNTGDSLKRLVKQLSADFRIDESIVDMIESLNRQLAGWAAFYQYTDYTQPCQKSGPHVFWKLGYWLARSIGVASGR